MDIAELNTEQRTKTRLVDACKLCYRKHVLQDETVDFDEVNNTLEHVLRDVLGAEFARWHEDAEAHCLDI